MKRTSLVRREDLLEEANRLAGSGPWDGQLAEMRRHGKTGRGSRR